MSSQRVLFTGGRSLATLALLRLFARAGHACEVAESQQPNPAGASRYCRHNHRLPGPQSPEFIPALEGIISQQKISLLIPTGEEIFYVSRHQRRLEQQGCKVFCPSSDLLTHLYSRYQLNQLLRALKLPVPACERVTEPERLPGLMNEWPNGVLMPEFGPCEQPLPLAARQTIVTVKPSEREPWVLQESLSGERLSSFSLAHNGQLRAHSLYSPPFSGSWFSPRSHPQSEHIAAALIKSLDLSGLLSLDFMATPDGLKTIACRPFLSEGVWFFSPNDQLPSGFFDVGPLLKPQLNQPLRARDLFLQLDDLGPLFAWLRRPRKNDSLWRGHWHET